MGTVVEKRATNQRRAHQRLHDSSPAHECASLSYLRVSSVGVLPDLELVMLRRRS